MGRHVAEAILHDLTTKCSEFDQTDVLVGMYLAYVALRVLFYDRSLQMHCEDSPDLQAPTPQSESVLVRNI